MSSPCSQKMITLRERNRVLLDQLESNSILLERRLKELKRTARTGKRSDKSRQAYPLSPLKRKYKSWKKRNYSGQVSAALNAEYSLSNSSSDSQELKAKYKQMMDDITSPSKNTKQNARIVSRTKGKVTQLSKSSRTPLKSSTATDVANNGNNCEDCYCKTFASKDGTHSNATSEESEQSITSSHIDSDHDIYKESSELHSPKYDMNDGITDNEQQRKTLEAARTIINYSPESLFLRRLKERSQALGYRNAPGNLRTTLAKPSSVTSPKKSQYSSRGTGGTNPTRTTKRSPVKANLEKVSPLKFPPSARSSFGRGSRELIPDGNEHHTSKQAPYHSPRHTRAHKDEKRLKNRKRVCYRKHCHCRVQQNIQSRKRFPGDTKENAREKPAEKQGLASPEKSPLIPCTCCCNGSTQKIPRPKTPLIASDIVGGLVDNEHDKKHIEPRCCCKQGLRWFDELNEFRQSHWFDCHAHPHPSCPNLDAARNLHTGNSHPTGHKCVHKYVLDDRLFARPLYTDHLNNSRCIECHLPHNTSQSRTRETPPITLPSTLRDAEFHVSVPVRSPRGTRPSASGNVLSQKKITHTSGRHRATPGPSSRSQPSLFTHTLGDLKPRAPPPVDSLALRYQKGVAK